MQNKQEQFTSSDATRISTDAASITGIIDFVSWYQDEPSLKFAQPGVAVHQRPDLLLSDLVGTEVRMTISEDQYCTKCGTDTESSPCPDCIGEPPHATCIMRPATHCNYKGCPYPDYKQRSCSHTHVVYFASTDTVKVGISRESRARCRWAEQGASHAIPIARAPNRKAAGIIEKALSKEWPQRCRHQWYQPMKNNIQRLTDDALAAADLIPEKLRPCYLWWNTSTDTVRDAVVEIPSVEIPSLGDRLTSTNNMLDTGKTREGRVLGIRGGLVATTEFVVNLTGYSSHLITLETNDPFFEDAELRVDVDTEKLSREAEQPPENAPISEGTPA